MVFEYISDEMEIRHQS